MLPLVAILGRPNVGKSTLFNRLIRSRKALVQNDPGVTRDRNYGTARFEGRSFNLIDTGGFEAGARQGIEVLIREQAEIAVTEADLLLLVLDARQGLTPEDVALVDILRRTGKPVIHIANKVDGPRQELLAAELYSIGAQRIHAVSAEHGLGFEELINEILERLPPGEEPAAAPGEDPAGDFDDDPAALEGEPDAAPEAEPAERIIRVALVGRPNAGKSSLLNHLLGEPRSIVSEIPGTTRDPIDALVELPGGAFQLVDTAGIRRRRREGTAMEKLAILRALRAIDRAEVTCLLIDAQAGVAEQDARIAGMALDAGRGLALVLTKMDLLPAHRSTRADLLQQIKDKLQFVPFAPVLFISSTSGQGVRRIFPTVRRIHRACGLRIATAELNRFLEDATSAHPPPAPRGRQLKFYYIVQPQAFPPTFLVSTNHSDGVHLTYRRYLVNRLRDRFGFEGSPIRLFFRQRGKSKR